MCPGHVETSLVHEDPDHHLQVTEVETGGGVAGLVLVSHGGADQ